MIFEGSNRKVNFDRIFARKGLNASTLKILGGIAYRLSYRRRQIRIVPQEFPEYTRRIMLPWLDTKESTS